MERVRGFTLIELIIVIILLALSGLFVFNYLGFGAQIFRDTTEREQLVAQSRFAVNRLTAELRNAVPRSVRTRGADSQRCLEFMPIIASSQYLGLPRPGPTASDPFVAIAPDATGPINGGYLMVYATGQNFIYGNSQTRRKVVTGTAALSPPQANLIEITYSGTPSAFGTESPARRYFIGGQPISWCYDESARALYRYQGYGLEAQQPLFGSAVLATASSAELMAENLYNDLGSNEFPFYVFEATLERNSLIQIDWRFRRDNAQEPLQILHEVHIPNVP